MRYTSNFSVFFSFLALVFDLAHPATGAGDAEMDVFCLRIVKSTFLNPVFLVSFSMSLPYKRTVKF